MINGTNKHDMSTEANTSLDEFEFKSNFIYVLEFGLN